ncbi:DUF485 domain-containing protein [Nocardioides caricicola]|uniref:DUF485 domain-containing protein n=1 Tax=Nocardioides caricicola TaxID=634770 RepID=A0ABW0N712_9ACTN
MADVNQEPHEQAARHDPAYDQLHSEPDFHELRRAYRAFVFPATVAFLSWYLLYVLMSMWAPGFMSKQIVDNINVALVFGLLQFVTTFLLAWLYSRYSTARLDPLARTLDEQYLRLTRGTNEGGR